MKIVSGTATHEGASNMKIPDKYVLKETEAHMIKIRFHYNGYFVSDPETAYKKGKFYELKKELDIDEINIIDLGKLVKELLGMKEEFKLWYGKPENNLSDGLRLLGTDKDVIRFINEFRGHPIADLYVETTSADFIDHRYDTDIDDEEIEIGSNEDNSDPEYVDEEAIEGNGYGSDSVSLDDSEYDENWEWTSVLPYETLNPTDANNHGENVNLSVIVAAESSRNPKATTWSDFEDEDGDSSDLQSPISSEDESGKKHYPTFKLTDNDEQVKFQEGQIFSSAVLIRNAVKEYGMQSRTNVYLKKNESRRLVVKCMPGCSFHMRFSKAASKNYFQLAKFNAAHTCHRIGKNRQCKTRWLAKKLIHVLKHTPNMKLKALQEDCKNKWGVMLSKFQVYRAKVKALEMIQGAISEQYKHLRSYAEELLTSNPGSTLIIKTTPGVDGPVFERMYVCFYACKRAFVTSCRPLIGLDGCFLKGTYGGQLLTAVGKDGNNQMMPIAFAIVEAETKDSWSWFIDLLLEDLNGFQYKKWSFISDQQKGLVPTIASTSDYVEHRLCVKHLYGNWRKKYPGDELKEALWAAARSTTMPEFTRAMNNLKKLNEAAWKDMCDLPASMWSRAAFSTHTCCDLQVNNMCEAFNSAILEYRDKPIISLVEGLKFYMTNRIVKLRDYMLRYEGDICPMIQKSLEKFKKDADSWSPNWCGDSEYSLFSASNGADTYVVNLKERTCSCRKWDLSGIPCCHGIACIWFNNQNPDDYVSHWYRKTTFLDTYNNLIRPSNGPKGWPIVDATPIVPPYVRRAPGRPKKARRKANDEPKGSTRKKRNQHTITCGRCGILGHNKRSCKGKTAADRMIPKGGNKSNSNMTQPGPSATTTSHAPTATTSKGHTSTGTKGLAATGPSGLRRSPRKRKNDNTTPNVITPSAATTSSGLRKSARIVTNAADPIGTQQSANKP